MQEGKEKILVVDDDQRICRLLGRYLSRNGMCVVQASNGTEMQTALDAGDIDLLLLDLVMPDDDGISLARGIRQESDIPIIILTGQSDTVDKVMGLEVGADDYITKPFDERELLARVRSVLRRHKPEQQAEPSTQDVIEFGSWSLNRASQELSGKGGEVHHLTKHEFILLDAFLKRPNRILTRNEILDLVASREWVSTDRSIDVLVGKLRKKVEADPRHPEYIHTQRGVGYKFSAA